ncbi:hypothetical protein A3L09_06255 [Thermococcus profundus]|uniref:MIP18 family-like domain-containing protein n=1 Tax=Thermococcus profundus TaxID=49899 RepID=A0A2Z2MLT6_THEPR|nr:iron-sulfur cluster assembly protein [Thermococcus profundus]ASJ02888.1 hypothetical protein A3L09_06255 [Thermococcus profundus]
MGLLGFFKSPKRGVKDTLPPEVKGVVNVLRSVVDPETGVSIVDEGLVYGLTVSGKNVDVFLLMARSTPDCHFCQMLAINVQNRILRDVVRVLKEAGFENVKAYNELGLLLIEG